MVNEWDDDGEFMSIADQLPELVDLEYRDLDISKALEGAALDHLNPEVKRFELHTDYSPSGDQPKAIEKLISQLENSQERCVLLGVTVRKNFHNGKYHSENEYSNANHLTQ